MEGGRTAQLSSASASFPVLAHSLSSHLCISSCPFSNSSRKSFFFLLSLSPNAARQLTTQWYFLTATKKSANKDRETSTARHSLFLPHKYPKHYPLCTEAQLVPWAMSFLNLQSSGFQLFGSVITCWVINPVSLMTWLKLPRALSC